MNKRYIVRRSRKEEEKWIHSACAMCVGAPMKVRVRDGKILEVKGEDIPGWNGKLCPKALSGMADRIYAPDRILSPLKRVGKRGEGEFVECSWEEVIDTVADKFKQYIDAGQPEAFEIWWGCPHQQDNVNFLHYWSAVTGAGISYLHGQVCFGDHAVEKVVTFGPNHASDLVAGIVDWPNTKYAVIAGLNFPGTSGNQGAPCMVPTYTAANQAKEKGCKFVIIDPKLTDSTPWCDEWVPINPGGDDVLALTIANVLIDEKLYDEDFLLKYTNASQLIREDNGQALKNREGKYLIWNTTTDSAEPMPLADQKGGLTLGLTETFEATVDGGRVQCRTVFHKLAECVKKYTPESTEFPEKTVEIARNLGKNRPSVVFYPGFTSGRYPSWFQTLRAYSVVNILLGNVDKPGGFYLFKHVKNVGTGWPEPPQVPDYRRGLTLVPGPFQNLMSAATIDKAPCFKENGEFHPATQALPWLHFDAIERGNLKAVLSSAENAAFTQTNTKWVEECLRKLDLLIVGEQLPKEILDLADYVVPEASYLERFHLYNVNYLLDGREHAMQYMRSAVIPPQGEAKPLSWFLAEVAKKVGLGEYFENLDLNYEWWNRMLKKAGIYPGVTAEKLIEDGPYIEDYSIEHNLVCRPIATRSKRFEIYSNELAEDCYYNPKSRWYQNSHVYPIPIHVHIATPKADDEFHLICGKASWHQKSATQHNPYLMEDAIEGGCPYTEIYINAARADQIGIKESDLVEIECVGPTMRDDSCVYNDSAIGSKEQGRVRVTEGLHPKAAWIYFATGHKSKSMPPKARQGIAMNRLVPLSVSPYAAGLGKNYSIVRIRKMGR